MTLENPHFASNRNPFNYQKFEQINRDTSTAWLTLEEITQQLNLFDDESQDAYLRSVELATRMAIEDYLGMSIYPVTYRVYYGAFTGGTQVSLDLPEVSQASQSSAAITIVSVQYYNSASPPTLVTVAANQYFYDPSGNKVIVSGLPNEINTQISNPITITYTANANPIGLYPVVKQAGLMLLTHIYNNRSNTTETKLNEIPFGVAALLRPYKPLIL